MLTIKMAIAAVLLAAAAAAAGTMLSIMGRPPAAGDSAGRRRAHRIFGRVFAAAAMANAVLGIILLARAGDALPLRLVLHWHLALALVFLLLLKIVVVRRYRLFLRWAPALGMALAALAAVIVLASAGFALIHPRDPAASVASPAQPDPGAAESGRRLFERHCSSCHAVDAETVLAGPSLKGVLKKALLPSGRPATAGTIRLQLIQPLKAMPSFAGLPESDLEALIAFLRTL